MDISINGTKLKQVDNFIYLGGKISQKGSCSDDIALGNHLVQSKTSMTFGTQKKSQQL